MQCTHELPSGFLIKSQRIRTVAVTAVQQSLHSLSHKDIRKSKNKEAEGDFSSILVAELTFVIKLVYRQLRPH